MLVPGPDTRVVELRVHGVHGTTPEALVDSVAAVDVAGDGVGRIVRPADRLRRPTSAPMLDAGGLPVSRTVEGYVWGGMTSGGAAKAIWALLFPFSLANVAHWMLPPVRPDSRAAAVLGVALRTLLRLAALLLTVLLLAQLTVVSFDLVAAQCLAPGSGCLGSVVPEWLREAALVRPVLGLLPVGLAVVVLHRVSTVDWSITLTDPALEVPAQSPPSGLPGMAPNADPDTPALRALHTTAALAVSAFVALGGPSGEHEAAGVRVAWLLALVLLAVSTFGVLLFDDPTGAAAHPAGEQVRAKLGPVPRRILVGLAALLLFATTFLVAPLPAEPAGPDATVESIAAVLAVVCVAVGGLLVPAALLARPAWATAPKELRPWAGGWFAAPLLVTSALLGGGFGAGIAITVRAALGDSRLRLPLGYAWTTELWGTGTVLGLVVAAVTVAVLAVNRWLAARRGEAVAPEVGLLHAGRPVDAASAAGAWWRAGLQRAHVQHVLLALAGVLSTGAALAAVLRIRDVPVPAWTTPLSAVGVAALGALAGGLLRSVYLAARRPAAARELGVLADLASYWPREAHPVVPPCYALKVVPEVAARAAEHLRDPNCRVVLTGHSQGSLLVAAAAGKLLAALPAADRERIGLVTAGSQLQWAYPRAFPAVVSREVLATLFGTLAGRWRALCRGTDPLGGAVTTWDRQVYSGTLLGAGYRADGSAGALPPAVHSPHGAVVLGGDHWLPDPERGPFPGRRWAAGVLRHGDYYSDPEWDRAVAIAAGLEPVPARTPPAAVPAAEGGITVAGADAPDVHPDAAGVEPDGGTKPADNDSDPATTS